MSLTVSQASSEAIHELQNELVFQNVLLGSIDDTVENREEAESEIRAEIKTLEKRLRDVKRSATSIPSSSTASTSRASDLAAFSPHTNSRSRENHSFQRPGKAAQDNRSSSFPPIDPVSSTPSTPISTVDPVPDMTSYASLPSRKRTHSQHLNDLQPFTETKSRRKSPSLFMMGGAMTPGSSSGDDGFASLDEEFLLRIQRAEEKMKQEKQDAEYARRLQEDHGSHAITAIPSSRAPSAFDRITGRRPQPSSSATPSTQSSASSHSQRTSHLKPEPKLMPFDLSGTDMAAYTANPNKGVFRVEAEQTLSRSMPGSFISDNSSNTDDSDIEIIDATEFNDNGRYSQPLSSSVTASGPSQTVNLSPSSSSRFQPPGKEILGRNGQSNTKSALQLAMFGNKHQRVPPWLKEASQGDSSSFTNSSANTYDSLPFGAGKNLNMGGLPGSYPGGSMNNAGSNTLGYTVNNVPTYGYNPTQQAAGFQATSSIVSLADLIRKTNNQSYEDMAGVLDRPIDQAMAGQVDYIMNDPRKTNEEIKALLENIRPDLDLSAENREGTPDGLKYPLYEHQKIALTWLKSMEEGRNKGGILADDMGLGKTISSLALILSQPSSDPLRKTTLIVGPVALVRQWEREIRQKVNGSHRLSVHMVHGQNRRLSWDELRNFDIVLTTYGTLGAEFKRHEKYIQRQRENGLLLDREIDQASLKKLFPLLSPKSLFYRVILDEAQCIKNKSTIAARGAYALKSLTRFCLTGTPMMNNVGELYSLIHFLRIRPYNDSVSFNEAFGMLTKGNSRQGEVQRGMRKLQAVLKAIMLRRVKGSIIDGKPIVTLPPKTEEIQHVVFDTDEQAFYNALESKTQIQFNKYMRAGTVGKNYSNILVLLLRLRQCCCHPHLITDLEEAPAGGADLSVGDMKELAKGLAPDVVRRLIAAKGVFDCPVCYDATTNPSIVIPCGHDTCSECLTQIADKQSQQNVANGEEGGGVIKCPSCRGNIDMKKIIDYSTFKMVHMPEPHPNDVETASENSDSDINSSETESDWSESDSDADQNGDLRNFIVPDIPLEETDDEGEMGDDAVSNGDGGDQPGPSSKRKSMAKASKMKEKRRRKAKRGKRKEDEKQHLSLAMLKKEASRTKEGRRRYMRYLKKHWQPSAKVTKCVELLGKFHAEGRKTIIFSQFVSLLDLLQIPIDEKGWSCERYDGSMNAEQRNEAIIRFTDKADCNIMLISLKAGNAGLNLVAASRVIILDPFWNPYIEMQAVDRAYRIGQQNSMEVHRILIEKTVEDRIIELQESKKKLINAALDEGAGKSVSRLGERELAFLFGVRT